MKRALSLLIICAMICVQGVNSIAEENDAMVLNNGDLQVKIGEYGEINSLKIVSDENEAFRNTEYVLNSENASKQGESEEHCWMGEVMLSTLRGEEEKSINTSESTSRKIERKGEKIEVYY
jgi:hypothetical protein